MKDDKSMKKACLAGLSLGQLLIKQVRDRYEASRASHSEIIFLDAIQSQLVTPGNRLPI